ncbi:hypothetical protein CHLNCDRAFT_133074 [Chlorella variabilis]|uniref:NAD(P)-binding domain-containing protein n=1 Tax=Chlorella variabilis TaxID=554065 RepID=E1Z2A6_CHLVA|nr:hypothetical protein CHLNCDRAFT_133074 [Chlorella variabilis]EFN59967.1 hypothetical protein CHLNCDRAFT_133074 [Chlorella variabilis]|eukprot:XP_005852069.1 hypothetical protein CHLNCDRAFT_133074 [Chlorella variabilis]
MSAAGDSKPRPGDAPEAAGVAASAQAQAAAAHAPSGSVAADAAASSSSATDLGDYHTYTPRIVVFGGSGFVGSRVCQQGLAMGAAVVSINRSGRPRNLRGDWGDALDPQQAWKDVLKGAAGAVSTMGGFGSNEHMYKVCGEANMRAMDAAAAAGVPRFSFVSVADYKLPAGWRAQDFLLRGYFQGKRDAEAHMAALFPAGGVALRPSFIYGSRVLGGGSSLPLGLVGAPLRAALSLLPTRSLANIPIMGAAFMPPVSVDAVAKALVSAALDPSVPPGIMDVWEIGSKYG